MCKFFFYKHTDNIFAHSHCIFSFSIYKIYSLFWMYIYLLFVLCGNVVYSRPHFLHIHINSMYSRHYILNVFNSRAFIFILLWISITHTTYTSTILRTLIIRLYATIRMNKVFQSHKKKSFLENFRIDENFYFFAVHSFIVALSAVPRWINLFCYTRIESFLKLFFFGCGCGSMRKN